ncbi:PilN domain-containing protein [Paenibacillus senegalimassiliensis]|uniref:PilN domain-containing protein n=1 Tax=Paenibacillus senegalimassiliensis TaxID=1737426 RepID=UPI00073E14FE|nr:PilN domain-containing protein [Paenibacillus senegalimassiliensis]
MGSLERDNKPMEINFIRSQSGISVLRKRVQKWAVATTSTITLLLLAWMWLSAMVQTSQLNGELDRIQLRISELQAPTQLSRQPSVQQIQQLAEQLKHNEPDHVELLEQFTRMLPELVNVQSLTMEGASQVKLTALYATTEELAQFVQSLRASEHFTVAELGDVEKVGLIVSGPGQTGTSHSLEPPLRTTLVIQTVSPPETGSGQGEGDAP